MRGETIQALLVDDEPLVREGLADLLRSTGRFEVIGLVGSAAEAHDALDRQVPDVVVTDLMLGDGPDGIQLTKAVAARHPAVPVLLVSGYDEALFAERALEAGAAAFVMKESPAEQLLNAIDTVLRGGLWVSDPVRAQLERPGIDLAELEIALGAPLVAALRSGNRNPIGVARRLDQSVDEVDRRLDQACRRFGIPGRVALYLSLHPVA